MYIDFSKRHEVSPRHFVVYIAFTSDKKREITVIKCPPNYTPQRSEINNSNLYLRQETKINANPKVNQSGLHLG